MSLKKNEKFEIPQEIRNPYKVHKLLYILIIGVALAAVFLSYLGFINDNTTARNIVRNVSYSCIASAVFAWIVDYVNVAEKNKKANTVYSKVYAKLMVSLHEYCREWATVCAIGFQDHNYDKEERKWIEWYEEVKKRFHELKSDKRQHELMHFFQQQFDYQANIIEEEVQHLQNISYDLMVNDAANKTILRSLEDLRSEFHFFEFELHAKYWLNPGDDGFSKDPEFIWEWMDAVNSDLTKYLNTWKDLSYLNEYPFNPTGIDYDSGKVLTAMKISEKKREIKELEKKLK